MKTAENIVNKILKNFGFENKGSFLEKLEMIELVSVEKVWRDYYQILKNVNPFDNEGYDYMNDYVSKLIKEDKDKDLIKRLFNALIYQNELLVITNKLCDKIEKKKKTLELIIECYMDIKNETNTIDDNVALGSSPAFKTNRCLLEDNENEVRFVEYYCSNLIGFKYSIITIKK